MTLRDSTVLSAQDLLKAKRDFHNRIILTKIS